MTDTSAPDGAPPADLTGPALDLWSEYIADNTHEEGQELVEPDARELAILLRACRAVAHVERLAGAVAALPTLVVTGSTGQVVSHPLLATLTAAERTALDALRALAVPADVSAVASAKAHARHHGPRG